MRRVIYSEGVTRIGLILIFPVSYTKSKVRIIHHQGPKVGVGLKII